MKILQFIILFFIGISQPTLAQEINNNQHCNANNPIAYATCYELMPQFLRDAAIKIYYQQHTHIPYNNQEENFIYEYSYNPSGTAIVDVKILQGYYPCWDALFVQNFKTQTPPPSPYLHNSNWQIQSTIRTITFVNGKGKEW